MKRSYSIKDIELVDDTKVKEEELLTGDVIKGLSPSSPIEPNVELEGNEYLQFADGETVKAVGKSHAKGGIKMSIPDGTKVVSQYLTFTGKQANTISKSYDLKVSAKDTYADALDKYSAKIGLKKLNSEQEELFTELKKEMSKEDIDKKTNMVNLEYLSKKIYDIENRKKPLEDLRKTFFNVVFDMQEEEKEKNPEKGSDDSGQESFKKGGISRKHFEAVCKQYGITPDQGDQILKNGGLVLPEMAPGGTAGEEPKFTYSYGTNTYKPEARVKQSAQGTAGYGAVKETSTALQQLYNNFPDLVQSKIGKYIEVDGSGAVTFKGGINLGTQQNVILDLQKAMDSRMNESAKVILNDPNSPEEEKAKAKAWLENEAFTGEEKQGFTKEQKVRAYDSKLGQFTAGRQAIGVDLVTEEDLKALRAKGITTVKQVTPEVLTTLSKESQDRIKAFQPKLTENSDFFINTIIPEQPAKSEEEKIIDPVKEEGKPITDKVKVPPAPRPARLFYTPDQRTIAPSGMEAVLQGNVRLERIDPVRIGIEQNLQEIANQRNFVTQQIGNLPEAQKAAVLANLMASSNKAINQAATAANVTNAQNLSQAELFNIQQSGNEQLYNLNNALSFEQRQLTAKAKTEEELRRFYDYNRKVNTTNFANNQKLNLMGSMFPDYQLDFMGAATEFAPQSEWEIDPNRAAYIQALGMLGQTEQPVT